MRDGRAVGVKVLDRRGPEPREVTHLAPIVISNVGAPITFGQMLPTDGEIGAKTADLRMLMERLRGGLSAVTLYLRLKAPVSTIGVKGENYWINATIDHDAVEEERSTRLLTGDPLEVYVSFPSAKSGDQRFHTAEIISFVDHQAFAAWRDQPKGTRGAEYSAVKQRISEGLLRAAETAIPGLTSLVAYAELSTPLTVEHYTSHPGGEFTACRRRRTATSRICSGHVRRSRAATVGIGCGVPRHRRSPDGWGRRGMPGARAERVPADQGRAEEWSGPAPTLHAVA